MKLLPWLAVILTSLLFLQALVAQEQRPGDKDEAKPVPGGKKNEQKPIPSDKEDAKPGDKEDVAKVFSQRHLKVVNATEEKLTVYLQYRTFSGQTYQWLPDEPQAGKAVSLELKGNSEMAVLVPEGPLAASRIRIWAQSETLKWETFREKDSWLVPEKQGDEHRYSAAGIETFTHIFAVPRVLAEKEAPPPAPTPTPGPSPVLLEPGVSLAAALPPEPPAPPADAPPVPLPAVPAQERFQPRERIPVPNEPPPPPSTADLGVIQFDLDSKSRFTATVKNFSNQRYEGGRRWYVLQAMGNAPFQIVVQGKVDPLLPNGQETISGLAPLPQPGTRLVFKISQGDDNPDNDVAGVTFVPTARSDLGVTLHLKGNTLEATITNHGPDPYLAGPRSYRLGDDLTLLTVQKGPIPDLAVGMHTVITLDVAAALGTRNRFSALLSTGDGNPTNDRASVLYVPKAAPDLTVTLALEPGFLVGTIVNRGPGDYRGGRFYTLVFESSAGIYKQNNVPLPGPLAPNTPTKVKLPLGVDPAKIAYRAEFHLSGGDANALNDYARLEQRAPCDLEVDAIQYDPRNGILVARLRCFYAAYEPSKQGRRSYTFEYRLAGNKLGHVVKGSVPPMAAGEVRTLMLPLKPGHDRVQFTATLRLDGGDNNPSNDVAAPFINKVQAITWDLAVSAIHFDATKTKLLATITCVRGDYSQALGGRNFLFEYRDSLGGGNQVLLPVGDLKARASRQVELPLRPGAAKLELIASLKLTGIDLNAANDAAPLFQHRPPKARLGIADVRNLGNNRISFTVRNSGGGQSDPFVVRVSFRPRGKQPTVLGTINSGPLAGNTTAAPAQVNVPSGGGTVIVELLVGGVLADTRLLNL
jgi:hypothetical protein